jgi:ATP-dependent RNA helicase RhlE
MPFSTLGLSSPLTAPLARKGYAAPTPVQLAAIPHVLAGRDLMVRAQTGTGKTAAFGLPIIERLIVQHPKRRQPRRPRALVLAPTRELATQVHQSMLAYGGAVGVHCTVVCGGMPMGPQRQAIERGLDILVATPGRLLDHMQQRTIDLGGVEVFVLDEADRMLDLGFIPAIRRIAQALPAQRQTLLFSATFPDAVSQIARDLTRDPQRIDISTGDVASTVEHEAHAVPNGTKEQALTALLTGPHQGQAIVFCKTKRGSNRVGERLLRNGLSAVVIHGNKSQNARNRALADFKSKRVTVLVATDIAARGLDIPQLPLVVNYDLPLVASDYVHRVGRTGRAGREGRAISLVTPEDRPLLRDIEKLLKQSIRMTQSSGHVEGARPVPLRAATGAPARPVSLSGAARRPGPDTGNRSGRAAGARPGRRPSRHSQGSPALQRRG